MVSTHSSNEHNLQVKSTMHILALYYVYHEKVGISGGSSRYGIWL